MISATLTLNILSFLLINFLHAGIFQKALSSSNVPTVLFVTHLFPITCKSRLCPSCGYRYSMTWSENIQRHILNFLLFLLYFFNKFNNILPHWYEKYLKFSYHNLCQHNNFDYLDNLLSYLV